MAARRINLLPPEVELRRRQRRLVSSVIAAGVAVVAVFALVYVVQTVRLNSEKGKLEAQQARNSSLKAKVAQLAAFDLLAKELKSKTDLVSALTQAEVRWSVLLADISLVIPSDAWLTSFTGNINVAAAAGGGGAAGGSALELGAIQLNGNTFTHVDVAKWLTRLAGVDAFVLPYLSLSSKGTIGETEIVLFTSSVRLSPAAFRKNQRGAERPI